MPPITKKLPQVSNSGLVPTMKAVRSASMLDRGENNGVKNVQRAKSFNNFESLENEDQEMNWWHHSIGSMNDKRRTENGTPQKLEVPHPAPIRLGGNTSPKRSKSLMSKSAPINPELLVALVRNKQNTETSVRAKLTTDEHTQSKPVERVPSKVRGWSYHCDEPKHLNLEDLEEDTVDDFGNGQQNEKSNFYVSPSCFGQLGQNPDGQNLEGRSSGLNSAQNYGQSHSQSLSQNNGQNHGLNYGQNNSQPSKTQNHSKTSNQNSFENLNSLDSLKQEPEIDLLKGIELELQKLKEENAKFFEDQRKKSAEKPMKKETKVRKLKPITKPLPMTKSTSQSSGFYEAPVAKPRKIQENVKPVKPKKVDSTNSKKYEESPEKNGFKHNKVVKRNSTSAKNKQPVATNNTMSSSANRVYSASSSCLVNDELKMNLKSEPKHRNNEQFNSKITISKSDLKNKNLNKETITALSERLTAAVSEQLREQLERLDSTREISSITELADKMDIQVNILPRDNGDNGNTPHNGNSHNERYTDELQNCVGEKVKNTRTVRKLKKVKTAKKDKKQPKPVEGDEKQENVRPSSMNYTPIWH